MPRHGFSPSVVQRVDQWAGEIFFRGGSPSEIEAMGYRRLKYWAGWHKLFESAERSAAERQDNA